MFAGMIDLSPVRLVAVDMDGTLLNSRHEVGEDFWSIYQRLTSYGVTFVAASGRQYDSIVDKLAPLRDTLTVIAENGALGVHAGETFVETVLPEGALEQILWKINARPDIHPVVCTRQIALIREDRPDFTHYVSEYYSAYATRPALEQVDMPVFKVALYHAIDSETNIYPQVRDLAPELEVKVSGKYWVDISHLDANKGHALRRLQGLLRVTPAQTLAIGDYNNDLEMLACADHSFAMANAHPNVLAAARYRTTGNDDRGVERVLERLLGALPDA